MYLAHADAGVPTEAFAEYAADSRAAWVTAHLLRFGGITGMTLATVLLARALAVRSIEIGLDALSPSCSPRPSSPSDQACSLRPPAGRAWARWPSSPRGWAPSTGTPTGSGCSTATVFVTVVSDSLRLVWLLLAAVWSWRRATLPASSAAPS